MKHTYKITGMTCNGCRTNVEDTLNNIKGVLKATVNLEEGKAEVDMEKHIATETLQQEFLKAGLHYTIADYNEHSDNEKTYKQRTIKPRKDQQGSFNCKIQCEGKTIYYKADDSQDCGLYVIEQLNTI